MSTGKIQVHSTKDKKMANEAAEKDADNEEYDVYLFWPSAHSSEEYTCPLSLDPTGDSCPLPDSPTTLKPVTLERGEDGQLPWTRAVQLLDELEGLDSLRSLPIDCFQGLAHLPACEHDTHTDELSNATAANVLLSDSCYSPVVELGLFFSQIPRQAASSTSDARGKA